MGEIKTENDQCVEVVEKKTGFKQWCKDHPDLVVTFFSGLLGFAGGIIKLIAVKSEYDDNLYTTIDEDVYKIPSKKMKTAKKLTRK